MPPLHDPIDPVTARHLRRLVLAWGTHSGSRIVPVRLGVSTCLQAPRRGPLEVREDHWDLETPREQRHLVDACLAEEVTRGLLAEHLAQQPIGHPHHEPLGDVVCHVSRRGLDQWTDVEALWIPAWIRALAECPDESLASAAVVVITRDGWWDPRSGARQRWRRLRDRTGRALSDPDSSDPGSSDPGSSHAG